MLNNKINFRYYDYLLIAVLFFLSFWLEQHIFQNCDVGWHILGAKRMLAGGTFSKNIFDDNLPMVYWFFIPLILINHLTSISIVTLTNFFVNALVLLIFSLSNIYLKEIYKNAKRFDIQIVRYAILILLFFVPGFEFAQRDMLVLLFLIPYVFLIAARLETNFCLHNNRIYLQLLIGFLATIGIAMDPFYILIIIALEIQTLLTAKKIKLWRLELITFFIMGFLYLLAIAIIYPDYFTVIVPSFFVFSPAYSIPRTTLFCYSPTIIISALSLVFFITYLSYSYRKWKLTLWLCSAVSYIIFLINGKIWLSHVLLIDFFEPLLFLIILFQALQSEGKNITIKAIVGLISFYFLLYFFLSPFLIYNDVYNQFKNPSSHLNQFITFFKKQPENSTFYALTDKFIVSSRITSYTDMINISPWPNCWMIRTIVQNDKKMMLVGWKKRWEEKYKKIFIHQVASDIQNKKPNFVIVDIKNYQAYLGVHFNYIRFLSQNQTFRTTWHHYHLVKKIDHYDIFAREG